MSKNRYKIVRNSNMYDLEKEVNSLIEEGWTLYGSPFTVMVGSSQFICQAVVNNKEVEKLGEQK